MNEQNEGKTCNIYAVKDNLVGRFMQPIFLENDQQAIRWFKNAINSIDLWKSSASDYTIHRLGTFNDKNGLGDYPVIEEIANGLSLVERS